LELYSTQRALVPVNRTYYDLLGVPTDATAAEINLAYSAFTNGNETNEDQLLVLNQAYRTLSDNKSLRDYDKLGVSPDEHNLPRLDTSVLVTVLLDCESTEPFLGDLQRGVLEAAVEYIC
jgi:curved DNA-binding protein CbpA